MEAGAFECLRADTVDHALELLADNPDAVVLAAGHSLMPGLNDGLAAPDTVIDIGAIDAMQSTECDDDAAHIGALTTYTEFERSEILRERATALAEAVSKTADTQIRNRATLGGNVVTPYPVSDLSGALIASDATIVAAGSDGERRIDAEDLVTKSESAQLNSDELLVRIEVPLTSETAGGAYCKKRSPVSRYTLVGVAARIQTDGRTVSTVRVAANGVLNDSVRLTPVEEALVDQPLDAEAIEQAASRATNHLDETAIREDRQASAAYRIQLLSIYTARALKPAADRAGASIP
jgi:carbon-monoxide dehydrogenase medium subunit